MKHQLKKDARQETRGTMSGLATKRNTQAPRETQRVTRADITMPDDSGKTAAQLQAEIDQVEPKGAAEGPQRRSVARGSIHVAERVFQWRGDGKRDQWTRKEHIYNLVKAISNRDKPLERLLVFPVGKCFYVIDGHHRLAAYDTARWTKGIPVEVFTGTLTEARVRALECNVKDKLAMTPQAKSEAAWRITKENLGGLTAAQVVEKTGISRRQVFNMRKVWKELNERDGINDEDRARLNDQERALLNEEYRALLPELTWQQARDMWEGNTTEEDFDHDSWVKQKAQEVIDLMDRHNVTAGLLRDTEITAVVLERLKEGLPRALISEWAYEHRELIEELAADIRDLDDRDITRDQEF
jgi:hypothetical protein